MWQDIQWQSIGIGKCDECGVYTELYTHELLLEKSLCEECLEEVDIEEYIIEEE